MSGLDYLRLPVFTSTGDVCLVVETPKGARAKFKFEPRLYAFFYSRPLACGLSYPFDWGFVPSTCAADDDPLDGVIIHDASCFPGVMGRGFSYRPMRFEAGRRLHTDPSARIWKTPARAG